MFSHNVVFNSLCFIILMFLCNKHGFVKSANETVCSEQSSLDLYDGSCNQSSQCITNSSDIMCVCPVNTHYNSYTASCVLDCKATATTPSGQIVSPNYPNLYPDSNLCTWTLTGTSNTYYVFSISDMDIENDPNCTYDSLKIYNGASGPLLATFCDRDKPTINVVASTTNSMNIVFKTDVSVGGKGFNGAYRIFDYDSIITEPQNGYIASPGYPLQYPANSSFSWTIRGRPGSFISFSISDMDIENSDNCSYGSLKIFDGTSDTQLATFCNRSQTTFNIVASTTNSMNLVFKTGDTAKGKGFSGAYRIFDYNSTITEPRNGYIASPGYPLQYPANSYFSWTIRGRPESFISFSISDIDIENSDNCTYGSLKIFDGTSGTQLATFCNRSQTTLNVVASTTNLMNIVFKTGETAKGKGFSGAYRIFDYNSTITGQRNGYIASPGYPLQYPANSYFSWTILGRPGSFISFSISDMDIENSPYCTYDSLEIYDGTSGPLLATFCSRDQTTVNVVASTTISMHIVFKTNHIVEGKGFSGAYRIFDYNTTITEPPKGYIASPGYPLTYPGNPYFSWTIGGRPGSFISLGIRKLTIESKEYCSEVYVQVYDGKISDDRMLNQECSNQYEQRVFMSTGSSLYFAFSSNYSITYSAVMASYEINECKTILTDASGEIASPGYPLNYVENLNCSWTIITDSKKRISLRIKEIYLNDHHDCTFDNLRIYDGENISNRLLATFCYLQSSYTIVSTSNTLYLVLKTDGGLNYKGFSATYSSSDRGVQIGDTNFCDPEAEITCNSKVHVECLQDKHGVFRCLCTSGFYRNGTCLPDSLLSFVLNIPPQIQTKDLIFFWTTRTDIQIVAFKITWVATEDSSDRGEMVAGPSGVQVRGLTPGTEYNFTVLTTIQWNEYYHDSVVPTHFTFETVPGPPGKLNECSSNLHTIPYVLRFEPSNGSVKRYNITVGGKSYEVFNPEQTIKDLTPDTQYNYTITAYNKLGNGSDDVTGSFKTEPVTSERESLNVSLVAGLTAASGVVLIVGAVIVTLIIRKRRRKSRPPTADASPDEPFNGEFMDTNMADVCPDVNIGEVDAREYIYMTDSPADTLGNDYIATINDVDYLDVQDDESIYDNATF